MQIKSSADLRNSYKEISDLAKASGKLELRRKEGQRGI